MVSRPAIRGSPRRMTLMPGGVSSGRSSGWVTSCTSPRPATTPRPAPAARTPRRSAVQAAGGQDHDPGCAQLVFPNLITHVATTDATVTDNQITGVIDDGLAGTDLLPGRHYLDSGYLSAALVVSEQARHGIALIGPLLADTSAQARAGAGYARADFTADYDTQTVTCPQGKTAANWTPCTQHGKDTIVATFSIATAGPARPAASAPAGNGASCHCCPVAWPKPRPPHAPRKPRSRSRPTTPAAPASRAPCTKPPATEHGAPATAACRKPASTTSTWPARSTCCGWRPTGPAPR